MCLELKPDVLGQVLGAAVRTAGRDFAGPRGCAVGFQMGGDRTGQSLPARPLARPCLFMQAAAAGPISKLQAADLRDTSFRGGRETTGQPRARTWRLPSEQPEEEAAASLKLT